VHQDHARKPGVPPARLGVSFRVGQVVTRRLVGRIFGLCNAALRAPRTLRMRSDATSVPIPSPLYSLLAPRAGADDALVRPLMMSEPKV